MKLTNIIKWILIGRVAYKLGKEKFSGAVTDWSERLRNAFSFEISRIDEPDVYFADRRINLKVDLWVKNNTGFSLEKADGIVKLKEMVLSYKGKKLGRADLSGMPLNFRPHEKKLVRGIPATLYFDDWDVLKEIIENWPDVDLHWKVRFSVAGKDMEYENIYNPKKNGI